MIGFAVKAWLDSLALPWYILTGRRPWTLGYYTAKKKAISRGIDDRLLMDSAALPKGYGAFIDERVVEYPWVFAQLPKNPGRLLDAGSALNHDFLLDRAPLSGAQLTVMTLAPEKRCFWNRGISYLYGDLREPHFPDACFDVVVSVSTIEHIGLDNTMLYTGDHTKQETDDLGYVPAIEQFRRVLKPGGVCLVTVPFGRRGTHGWYQVFDERGIAKVIETFAPTTHSVDYFGHGETGWYRSGPSALADAEFHDVHQHKRPAADRAAGARAVACIRLVA